MNTVKLSALFLLGIVFPCAVFANQTISMHAHKCFEGKNQDFSDVLTCYDTAHKKFPVTYEKKSSTKQDGVTTHGYALNSQEWEAGGKVTPDQWQHKVDIYIPDNALKNRALLIINNGINISADKNPIKEPTDYSDATLRSIAKKTRTITIAISDVPNQFLSYQHAAKPKKEDDSVAYSWKLFLDAPEKNAFASLHIPMMEAAVKAMDLAQEELKEHDIRRFIVAGTSKRAWSAWHTALVDERVDAIVPFVIDILNTKKVIEHTYRVYGNGWPMAFRPYFAEGITERTDTDAFEKLMQIEDPLQYLNSDHADRLAIPKYIVNASGDSFFAPDNSRFYFNQLPGINMLRVIPNSDHYGVTQFTESALVPFINRFQRAASFPTMTTTTTTKDKLIQFNTTFSEQPTDVKLWTASNTKARDFRYGCGIRYTEQKLTLKNGAASAAVEQPVSDWTATFIEATFDDGLVLTSQVHVAPHNVYPAHPEPSANPACQILTATARK